MDPEETVIIFIIFLAVILLVFASGLPAGTIKTPHVPQVVLLTNQPEIEIEANTVAKDRNGQGCSWGSIKIPIKVKFSTNPSSPIKVQPLVLFHGKTFRPYVEKVGETFDLPGDNPQFDGVLLLTDIVTSEPPIKINPIVGSGDFKPIDLNTDFNLRQNEKAFLQTRSGVNYTIKLTDISKGKGESVSEKISNWNVCAGTFEVECSDKLYSFDLFPIDTYCKNGILTACQKIISMCNNTLTIETGAGRSPIDCAAKTATIVVEIEEENPYARPFPVGEQFGLAFFRVTDTHCIDSYETIKELKSECNSDYLGGPYDVTGPVYPYASGC
jgi:hypothetical protein